MNTNRTYERLASGVHGVLSEPARENRRGGVVFVFAHPDADFTAHSGLRLAERGYRTLGLNTAGTAGSHLHDRVPDLGSAVRSLRDRPEIESVILVGHSGGAHLCALYQNVAEKGIEVGQGSEKIYPLPDRLGSERLPPADGLVLLDGHAGYAAKGLIDIGPQVVDPDDPRRRREDVDMLDPENGYDPAPGEPSSYPDEFLDRFYDAQADRMEGLLSRNRERLSAIESGEGRFPDDDSFLFVDNRSRVFRPDPTILAHTSGEWPLVHAEDSSVSGATETRERIDSIRGVVPPDYEPPITYGGECHSTSVRRFLSTRAIRPTDGYRLTEDSIEGIDWNSSNATTPGNLGDVSAPLLIMAATGHYFVVQAELFYEHAGDSAELCYIEGAAHDFTRIGPEYGDTLGARDDRMDDWAAERFV